MRLFAEVRTREHLTPGEVDTLIEAAKKGRHDATAILVAFRHGAPSGRVVRPALGSGGFWGCCAPCEADQERDQALIPCRPMSCERCDICNESKWPSPMFSSAGGVPCPSRPQALPDGGARGAPRCRSWVEGASAHASRSLRVRAGQQGARRYGDPGISWPAVRSTAVYRALVKIALRFLEGISGMDRASVYLR
jgi:hypothetical protein